MKDVFGKALLDYYNGNYTEDIITSTSISDEDKLPIPYLFRVYNDMPRLEQKAMQLCKGKTLDVGCGSGTHSLYLQHDPFLRSACVKNIIILIVLKLIQGAQSFPFNQ